MFYYEIIPRDPSFQAKKTLSYSSSLDLAPGHLVLVPLKNKVVLGIIVSVSQKKPPYSVKQVVEPYPDLPNYPKALRDLFDWFIEYYPGPVGISLQQFLPRHVVKRPAETELLVEYSSAAMPKLTGEQQQALHSITNSGTYLLHGETGTGKTRVYIELAAKQFNNGRSTLILVPEISLTSQLAADFKKVFGNNVIVIHSQLTEKKRSENWWRILHTKSPLIVIGPRSALFSPLSNLGLIVVDEAHETAFKQEQMPYYHALRVASKLAEIHQAIFLLGSATPSVTDFYIAEQKNVPILRMKQLAVQNKATQTIIKLVDLRDKDETNAHPYLSKTLLSAIDKALSNKTQVLLFLNRRGTARVVFCENCGWRPLCPNCDLPLIYHGDSHTIQCHTCGYSQEAYNVCPVCHKEKIVFQAVGTKAIADAIGSLYPQTKVRRFDTDNKKVDRFDQHYDAIKKGEVDVLIGTQTLVKGLDLPKLGLVGVLLAETSLYFPDFTASERTYQLLTQVIGRVGRGHRNSAAIIQTYDPTHPVIKAAIEKDWKGFYQNEIAEREDFIFPPFCYLLKLTNHRANVTSSIKSAEELKEVLISYNLQIQIAGPAPAFYEKLRGKYQWQLIIKAKRRSELIKIINKLPSGWSYDIDPVNLL